MLEACGRLEAPANRVFRLHREGLEKDFNPVTVRSLGPGAVRRGESNSFSCYILGFLLWSKDFLKDMVPPGTVNPTSQVTHGQAGLLEP